MTSGQEALGVQSATESPGAWSAAIVVSHRIGLSAASPYVEELIRLGFEVVIYCLGDFEQTARSLWPNPTVRISGSDALSDPKWAALHRRAAESLSRLQPGLNPDQRPNWSHRSMPARRALRLTRRMLSRFDANTVNRWLSTSAAKASSVFTEDVVFVVTTSTRPWLHAAGNKPTISVTESWDHPVRRTAGYRTNVVLGWNRDIGDDWVQFQGADASFVAGPWKLAYAIDAFPLSTTSADSDRPRLLYAVGTSSATPQWFNAEYRLIELVADAACDAGWDVTLKLKPNGKRSDYADIAERYDNVRLTDEKSSPNPMDYHLGDAYNQQRLRDLADADLVINAVTTFALDAACAGVPVLQLAEFAGDELSGIRSASRNFHLQKYLLNDPLQVFSVDSSTFRMDLSEWLRDPDRRAANYTARVREWLVPDSSLSATLRTAVSSALAEVGLPINKPPVTRPIDWAPSVASPFPS